MARSLKPDAEIWFTTIAETYDQTDIALIKGTLAGANIPYVIHGELMTVLRPFHQLASIKVRPEDAERAVAVLKDLKLSFLRIIFGPVS
jgi:hypothetical protein